jgi:iron complex transport system substrate-binding protein
MKICSLLPSATDILLALGLGDDLAAVTHECDLPAGMAPRPAITRSTLATDSLNSRDIDTHVTAAAHGGSSLYVLDHALLEKLDPDLIVTQELCEVCAIGYQQVAAAVRRLDAAGERRRTILSVEPRTLAQIFDAIVSLGEAAGVRERALRLVADLRARMDGVAAVTTRATSRPRVLAMEWLEPPYTAGHWVPELVRLAGGYDALGRDGGFSYAITWDDVVAYDPDVLIFMPCSFDLDRTLREAAPLSRQPWWPRLAAVRDARVYAVDGARYFSRHGPSIADGLAMLAAIIHPELDVPGVPATGWQRVAP